MNGNKPPRSFRRRGLGLALAFSFVLSAPAVRAQEMTETAPAMSGVQEILLQYAKIGSNAKSGPCAVTPGEITTTLQKKLKGEGVPVLSVIDAKPPMIGVARIELLPEIILLNSQGVECTSWVTISAQTQNTLRIPPIDTPRSVIVTYWRGGLLINSSQTTHPRVVAETFEKLARQFAQQYKLDQPPELPTMDAMPETKDPNLQPDMKTLRKGRGGPIVLPDDVLRRR